jgi:hypothetical protein
MKENLELMQTLTARICHDLAGSIGTIDNCLGLMEAKDESIRKQSKLLANTESSNLIKKIQVFRECYGARLNEEEMSIIYLSEVLKDLFVNDSIQLTTHFEDEILLDPILAKAVMCLILLGKEQSKTEKIDWFFNINCIKITASGKGLKLKKGNFWEDNNSAKTPITIANVRQHYINMMCDIMGYKITVSQKENIIEYVLEKI